jgi:predicted phage tail protein
LSANFLSAVFAASSTKDCNVLGEEDVCEKAVVSEITDKRQAAAKKSGVFLFIVGKLLIQIVSWFASLCVLCVLCASVVNEAPKKTTTENTEDAQRLGI